MKPDASKCCYGTISGSASKPRWALPGSAREQVRASPEPKEVSGSPTLPARARTPRRPNGETVPGARLPNPGAQRPPAVRKRPHPSRRSALIYNSGLRALCADEAARVPRAGQCAGRGTTGRPQPAGPA